MENMNRGSLREIFPLQNVPSAAQPSENPGQASQQGNNGNPSPHRGWRGFFRMILLLAGTVAIIKYVRYRINKNDYKSKGF